MFDRKTCEGQDRVHERFISSDHLALFSVSLIATFGIVSSDVF